MYMKWTIFTLLVVLTSCKSNNGLLLVAHEWQLKELKSGTESFKMPESVPTLLFTDSAAVYGFAGCNRFFGRYTANADEITIAPGGMTMAFCPDMDAESRFVRALAESKYYSIRNNELEITDSAKTTTLLFIPKEQQPLVGVANDAHGCNAAAGYTWSEVLQKCIRLFESGIRMNLVDDPDATLSAFIVFSADSLKAEVFLPNVSPAQILDRRELPNGQYAWNIEDDSTLNVRKIDNKWVIEQRMNVLYKEAATTDK